MRACACVRVYAYVRGGGVVRKLTVVPGSRPQACWRSVAEIYLRVLAMPQGQVHPDLVEQQIDTVVDAMKRLGLVFPISSACLSSSLFSLILHRPSRDPQSMHAMVLLSPRILCARATIAGRCLMGMRALRRMMGW